MTLPMQPYWLSKWTCPIHGTYEAKTAGRVDPADPVICPECRSSIQFDGQCQGRTIVQLPWVSKPRVPNKDLMNFGTTDNAVVRKRGRNR